MQFSPPSLLSSEKEFAESLLASLGQEAILNWLSGAEPRARKLEGFDSPWRDWLARHFPHVTRAPFAERHVRLWERFEALAPGTRPRPHCEFWGRGGAKSTTVQLCSVRSCVRLSRRFALYVSSTARQAHDHLASISRWLEAIGVERDINQYGASRGWNVQQLRTANGWNCVGLGLDQAIRGVKLEELRPDLVIFDDVDDQTDTLETINKKLDVITRAIIPTGSTDCAYFVTQNLVHQDGIAAQLLDDRADWLADREVHLEPAAYDLEIESRYDETISRRRWYVLGGVPTWEGQSLAVIEEQVNSWGKRAFLIEAQHEVRGAQGIFFNVGWWTEGDPSYSPRHVIDKEEVPKYARRCEAWDLAATEGAGDFTCRFRMSMVGTYPTVTAYIEEVGAGQWSSDRVRNKLKNSAVRLPPGCMLRLPRDPGQAGLFQESQLRKDLQAHAPRIRPVSGSKAVRARGFAECVNLGNCYLVRGEWMRETLPGTNIPTLQWLLEVLRRFTEDETHEIDDPVDAGSDAWNELALYPDPTSEEKARDRDAWLPEALRSPKREEPFSGDGLDVESGHGSRKVPRALETLWE